MRATCTCTPTGGGLRFPSSITWSAYTIWVVEQFAVGCCAFHPSERKRAPFRLRPASPRSLHGGATMPSPFPGMNPYIERASVWHDFHESFMPVVREILTAQ